MSRSEHLRSRVSEDANNRTLAVRRGGRLAGLAVRKLVPRGWHGACSMELRTPSNELLANLRQGFQMFSKLRAALELTTIVVGLAANACAVHGVAAVESAAAKLSCAGGSIQSAADATLYSACDSVNGDLRISASDLTDLSALAGLHSVSGKLEIVGNPQLDQLSGLEQLQHAGSLSVRDNAELDDLSALAGLANRSLGVIEVPLLLRERRPLAEQLRLSAGRMAARIPPLRLGRRVPAAR